ncbi:hypothetical protein Q0Z83_017900 [Actinoplanes sichuanensis]|uniref:Uncharacterized protein n=1 Tax=Actinoplanes sichuanensis TaxID=512349 RepID=A0ABW4A7B0_9ACTN|nr:hypothetical protein [Actinoplanes sichuanensis]BEL03599.1 hypothetical protein Q0Z83_017900 [Actinoplanes sichuanensis]
MSETWFLISVDAGMSSMPWRIRADSARQIRETFAEVAVVAGPAERATDLAAGIDDVDIDSPVLPSALAALRATRDAQRDRPGFGALLDRDVIHLRARDDESDDDTLPEIYLMELGPDGHRRRQVEIFRDGTSVRIRPEDILFDPPADLYDPDLAAQEITAAEFEEGWRAAGR